MKPFSVKVILRLGSVLYGLRVRVPAGLSPAVSANIPSLPEISSWLLLMVMLPPASLLVAPTLAVALSWAFSPIFSVSELMLISPAFPALLVSVVRLVPFSRVKSVVLILIWPALPLSSVEAFMATPFEILRLFVSMSMMPAFPAPFVSTEIFPSPFISIVFEALISYFPHCLWMWC